MSDLVKRLRISRWESGYGGCEDCTADERLKAADRIEELEGALREAREDIGRHHARGSEYEGSDEEAVRYIDVALKQD